VETISIVIFSQMKNIKFPGDETSTNKLEDTP